MKRRQALSRLSPNQTWKNRKLQTYGKRSTPSYKDSASTLFDAAVTQERLQKDSKVKRRVRFSDPLTEEIPNTLQPGFRYLRRHQETRQDSEQPVNRVLNFDSDDETQGQQPSQKTLSSFVDEVRWSLKRDHDPDWYPEIQPDDVRSLDTCPWISLEDENGSLLMV